MASPYRTLTLTEKISLIKDHANANGLSQRKLAEKYKISKGAIGNDLQRKDEYEKDFAANTNKESKRKLRINLNKNHHKKRRMCSTFYSLILTLYPFLESYFFLKEM